MKSKNKLRLNAKSKILVLGLIIIASVGIFAPTHSSLAACTTQPTCTPPSKIASDGCSCTYVLLAPLPTNNGTPLSTFDPTGNNKIGEYLNLMIKIFIGLCAVLAVIMIVIGGIEYMTSELISNKEEGRKRITDAILGLLLALGAWTLLYTINPNILKTDLNSLADVTVDVDLGGENMNVAFTAIDKNKLQALGITDCTGSGGKGNVAKIAQEFIGKTNYDQASRNTISGSTINVDCSSFVDQVYSCAGLDPLGSTTAAIFSNGATKVTPTTFDPTQLHPGDLVGWKQGDSGSGKVEKNGHVMIYLGNGKVLDTQGNKAGGTAIRNLNDYTNRITYVNWSKP